MPNNLRRALVLIASFAVLNCRLAAQDPDVQLEHLQFENCWIVDHKAVTITKEIGPHRGRRITIPIFNGQGPTVAEDDLYKQLRVKGIEPYLGQSFCLLVAKCKVKTTVHEILDFYAQSILRRESLSKPTYLAECDLYLEKACTKRLSMDDGTATWKNVQIEGVPDNSFQIFFPAKSGVMITIKRFEDIPIAEDGGWQNPSADARSKKYALIKWTVR